MRDVPRAVDEAFYAGRRSERVPFVINDSVDVRAGPCVGRAGAVISIEAMEPELVLLVELGDGADVLVAARDLRLQGTET